MLNYLILSNSLKPEDTLFTVIYDIEKQQIVTF